MINGDVMAPERDPLRPVPDVPLTFDPARWAADLIMQGTESITPGVRRIVLTLSNVADEDGQVQVGRPRLAADADVSERFVRRIMRNLTDAKWVELIEVGSGSRATLYALRWPPGLVRAAGVPTTPEQSCAASSAG